MEYGINLSFFTKTVDMEHAAQMAAKAGFTKLDYTPPVGRDNWMQVMTEHLKIFADNGLTVHQTHAPFNRYNHHGDQFPLRLQRAVEATALLDAEYMVVHGDEFNFADREFSPEAALEYNHDLFLPCVEAGKSAGYCVAFETVFEDLKRRRFTSQAEELLALIRSFHSENAVCCWDTGHGHVAFRKTAPEKIRQMGSLIRCTHIHDNAGNDSHQMPMSGDIDWQETITALKEGGYNGVISVEYAHGKLPETMVQDYMDLTFRAAQHIWSL